MAYSFSNDQLNKAKKNYYGRLYVTKVNPNFILKLTNKLLIFKYYFKYLLINIKRKIFRFLDIQSKPKSHRKAITFSLNLNKNSIKKISRDLKSNNFVFVKNFLSTESYKSLLNSWPNINYFNHNKKIVKHYNAGFFYSPENPFKKTFSKFNDHYVLRKFYEFLLSNKFKKIYNDLVNFENMNYELWAIHSTMATKNSYLAPHIDDISKSNEINRPYNFIYFLDGFEENQTLSGATGIYKDNNFKLPLLIPDTIKNSLLIYSQSEKFFHGFKKMECPKNTYRKTINFQIKPFNEI